MFSCDKLIKESRRLLTKEKYEEALSLLTNESLDTCKSSALYYLRGIAWAEKQEHLKAIDDYNKAIELNPNDALAYYNRGVSWMDKQEHDEAIKDYSKAIELHPQYALAYGNRGNTWYKLYKYDNALKDYSKAIEFDPYFVVAYYNRALVWYEKNIYAKAIDDLSKIIEITSADAKLYFDLGSQFRRLNWMNTSSSCYKRSYYLGYGNLLQLIDVFKYKFESPFILKDLFLQAKTISELPHTKTVLEETVRECLIWDNYLLNIQQNSAIAAIPEELNRLQGIANYHMGNSIEAYRIFDTRFETDNFPFKLSLRDQYYFTKSAIDFLEPYAGILSYALEQANAEGETDDINRYYAGQLFLLNNDTATALKYFEQCENFLPALIAKVNIYRQKNEFQLLRSALKQIADIDLSFINGMSPVILNEESIIESSINDFYSRIYYYELLEEIKETRLIFLSDEDYKHLIVEPYKHLEFYDIFKVEPSFGEKFYMASRLKQLHKFEIFLTDKLAEHAEMTGAEKLHHEITYSTAGNLFVHLEQQIKNKKGNESAEDLIAIQIHQESCASKWCHKLVLYYYLTGEYDKKIALRLFLYTIKIEMMRSDYRSFSDQDKAQFANGLDILVEIIKFPVSIIYKALSSFVTATNLHVKQEEMPDDLSTDYRRFQKNYLGYVSFFERELLERLTGNPAA